MLKAALGASIECPVVAAFVNAGTDETSAPGDGKTNNADLLLDCILRSSMPGFCEEEYKEQPAAMLERLLVLTLKVEDCEKYTAGYNQTIPDLWGWKTAIKVSARDTEECKRK